MVNSKYKEVIEAIDNLYSLYGGAAGGYGHIVFDDDNVEDHHIVWCIEEASKGVYNDLTEEVRRASLAALRLLLEVKEEDRQAVIDYRWGF